MSTAWLISVQEIGGENRRVTGTLFFFFFNFLKISCLTVPFFRVLELVVV